MKKKNCLLFMCAVAGILLLLPGCPAEEAGPWTLNVGISNGVQGSPAAGSYSYDDGTVVTYNYSLQPNYSNLSVTLDGATIAESGSINMDNNHDLVVSASVDIRGDTWTGFAHHDIEPAWKKYAMEFTFAGNIDSGTVTGTIVTAGNVSGTWTLDGADIVLSLTINGSPVDMIGTMATAEYMNGTYDAPGGHGERITGTWYLER